MPAIERINYPALGEVKAPYVHAVKQGNTLYISGLTAFGTPAQKGSVAQQAEAIFEQFQHIAQTENTTLNALLKVTIFITSFDDIDALRQVLFRYYDGQLPACSLVEVSRLFSPDLNIEVEGIMAL